MGDQGKECKARIGPVTMGIWFREVTRTGVNYPSSQARAKILYHNNRTRIGEPHSSSGQGQGHGQGQKNGNHEGGEWNSGEGGG